MTFKTLFLERDHQPHTHIIHLFPDEAIQAGVRPTFSEEVIDDMENALDQVAQWADDFKGMTHVILKSDAKVFCLGGDLFTIIQCARGQNRAELTQYIFKACRFGHRVHGHLHPRVHTIALVEGTALGGGFEVALGCETLIGEEGVKFGLPEIAFGSFAGVGAYSFLSRLVGQTMASRMMINGKNYTSEQLFDLGVVDEVAPKGEGLQKCLEVVQRQQPASGALSAMKKVKTMINPVTLTELEAIAEIWIDLVMGMEKAQLDHMEALVLAQNKRVRG